MPWRENLHEVNTLERSSLIIYTLYIIWHLALTLSERASSYSLLLVQCHASKRQLQSAQGRVLERKRKNVTLGTSPVCHVRPVRTATYSLLYAAALTERWYVGSYPLPRVLPWADSSWAFSPTSQMSHDVLLWGQYVVQLDSSTFHSVPQYVLQRTRVFMRNVLRYERTNMSLDVNQECFGF